MAFAGAQAFGQDLVQEACSSAVIQELRWLLGLALDGNGIGRVALHGADAPAVVGKRKALLVAAADHSANQLSIERVAGLLGAGNQRIDLGPAFAIQRQPDGMRLMAQHVAEELAGIAVLLAHVVVL